MWLLFKNRLGVRCAWENSNLKAVRGFRPHYRRNASVVLHFNYSFFAIEKQNFDKAQCPFAGVATEWCEAHEP